MPGPADYNKKESYLKAGLWPWTVRWHIHKHDIERAVRRARPFLKGDLLDVGCGIKPYESLLSANNYVGIDIASSPHNQSAFDKVYDGVNIPYKDNQFDSVLCTEVLEHTRFPSDLMKQIARVLKNGGFALITAPMIIEHHESPFDMQRYTYYGIKALAENSGLTVQWIQPRGGYLTVLVYFIYLAIDQWVSVRPLIDVIYYCLFPFAYVLLKLDKFTMRHPPIISMGWQMLARK